MELKITCACPDLSNITETSISDIIDAHADSDIIVFPEYLLELAPEPKKPYPNQLIFFGSERDLNYNKTRISLNGDFLTYNKQKLTPWEKDLKAGSENICVHYKGAKIGLAVCYDIEFPELVPDWRADELDIMVVPSATESVFGYERVNRCASARSVELGCAVVTCHLIGETENDLVDVNVGNHHLYYPSQSSFDGQERNPALSVKTSGEVIQTFTVNIDQLRKQKEIKDETNPAL